jgi:steroid delta-isomerase-like uncharacterized protein
MDPRKTLMQFYDAFNRHEVDGFDDLVADNVVDHEVPEDFPAGLEGIKQYLSMFMAAFPDIRFEPLEVIVEGNWASARGRSTGTHKGEFLGIPATGRSFDVEFSDWVRFDDNGRAVEHWGYSDNLKLMQQLGVIPENP